jgi:hypothetical protein
MASTYSAVTSVPRMIVMGNQRVTAGTFTLSGSADTIPVPLKFCNFAMVTPQTAAVGSLSYVVTSGTITVNSSVSNSKYNVVAWGK